MRNLTDKEVAILQSNHCHADDWSQITVTEGFSPEYCHNVSLHGICTLGDFSGSRVNEYGIKLQNGIRHARINNCTIGDGACIDHVHDCISNYDIGKDVTICNANLIAMKGSSSFGIGVRAAVLNETGGMEIPLSHNLNAQTAYMMTLMGQDRKLRQRLVDIIDKEAQNALSTRGTIGDNVTIRNSGTIVNAWIGPSTKIDGTTYLENCSLCSSSEHPIEIGYNVMGKDFIASLGSKITGSSIVERCFIGQSVVMDHLFSAHDSVFFANCALENGEACAVFAGPFVASHHKSSLLIAGYFSFLNAGSGSNQSNHLYKLGPMHSGVVERGSKTSSDSYVLWPSRIGAFSLIMGRHVNNVDTTDFPFSYLVENDNQTYLVPGRNLLSVGTMRDAKKWPQRDKRPKHSRPDCINYNLLSPFTIGKMEVAYNKLKELRQFLGGHDHVYVYNNLYIRPSSLKKGLQIYRWGIEKFIGNSLIQRIQDKFGDAQVPSETALIEALKPDHNLGLGEWIDMSGMIAPAKGIKSIKDRIRHGELNNLPDINKAVRELHSRYYDLEWDWSYDLMRRWYKINDQNPLTIQLVRKIISDWIKSVISIDNALYDDARKEYEIISRVNFGIKVEQHIDSDKLYIDHLNGEFEQNSVVLAVKEHIERKKKLSETILAQLSDL